LLRIAAIDYAGLIASDPRGDAMRASATLLVVALSVSALHAQTAPPPRISVVMPPGAKAGASVELTVTGQDLETVEGLHVSFAGAKVEVLSAEKAPPSATKKPGGRTAAAATNQKFKLTVPADAPLGFHDLRVVTKGGVSNPRTFLVGDQTEALEKEPNDDVPQAQKIELNTTVSGVIGAPTDVDYLQFTGKKGQRVVVSCLTSSIDSKLPALLQVYSSAGQYLGFNRNYWNNDAVADVILPADGDYLIRLCSFTYTQGGPDYFYRLTVSTAPWVDAVFPPVVEPGKEAKVTLYGRNLPGGVPDTQAVHDERPLEKTVVSVKAPGDPLALQRLAFRGYVAPTSALLDGFEHHVKNSVGRSNPVLLGFAKAPVILDNETNDTLDAAQRIAIPCEIAGRVEKKGDRDFYRFTAKKDQVLSIEVFADRLGSAMDMQFAVHNEKGDKITEQDDNPEILAMQLFNRSDDPQRYRFTAPAEGTYTLAVTSKEAFLAHGPRYIYTVRIGPEEPDFRIVAMPTSPIAPDSLVVGQAGHQAWTVFVQRLGGFTGDITLVGEKLPPGLTLRPQIIAANQKQSGLVVSAAPEAPPYVGPIQVVASAMIDGKKVTREVRAATITWPIQQQQQNTPTITRLDRELILALRDKAPYSLSIAKDKISVLQGEKIIVPVKLTLIAADFKANVQVSALALPTGMAMQPATLAPGKDVNVTLDSKTTVLPGNYTLVLRGQTQPPQPNQQPKPGGPRNLIQMAPPIAVTIVPKQLAKLTVPQNNPKIKAGGTADVIIKVNRQFDYRGPFKVEVDAKSAKGISAQAATIKAGEEEVKLTLTAAPGTPPGGNPTVTVRVTAMFNDTLPVVHEGKFTVAVTK
jgi:hypothetical protein